jgi:hypothetical protein
MMFSKLSLIVLIAIMALASATEYNDDYSTVSKARSAVRWALPVDFFPLTFSPVPLLLPIG